MGVVGDEVLPSYVGDYNQIIKGFFVAHIAMELSFTTSNFRRRILNKPELTASLPVKIGRGPQKERRKSSNHQSLVAFAVSFREGIHESVMP